MLPTRLVEEKPVTANKTPASINQQQHSAHKNAQNSFIDNIIEEISKDGNNSPPRFVKEITNNNEKEKSNSLFKLPQSLKNSVLKSEISSPFSPHEIATDQNAFENFDIVIEEIPVPEESELDNLKTQNQVKEVFKSPVSSLTLPAVAIKLAKDIDENHNEFDKIGINNNESPIIDLSNLDIFSDFGLSSSKFLNDEEIPLFDGKKEKRNPASSSSVSDNIIVVVLND